MLNSLSTGIHTALTTPAEARWNVTTALNSTTNTSHTFTNDNACAEYIINLLLKPLQEQIYNAAKYLNGTSELSLVDIQLSEKGLGY